MSSSNNAAAAAGAAVPPRKYHSERASGRSRSNSGATAAAAAAAPASSPSPPPTASCPHLASLSLQLIRQRLRSRTFQNAFAGDSLECVDCEQRFPKDHLWVCLHCNVLDATRCGRYHAKHSAAHARATKHVLAMHLSTRVIWCYECDNEVPDEYETKGAVSPQLVRSALDKEDAAEEVEQGQASNNSAMLDNEVQEDPSEAYRSFYTNPNGGRVGLANLGNTCFFNAGVQALLHCPPLIAFFAVQPLSEEERYSQAMYDARTPGLQRTQESRLKLLGDFSLLLQKTWGGKYSLCIPTDVLRSMLILNPFFRGYGQHDSQELVRSFFDHLHEGSKMKIEYEYDLRKKLRQEQEEHAAAEAKEKEDAEREEKLAKLAAAKRNAGENGASNGDDAAAAAKKPVVPPPKRYADVSIIADLFQGTLDSSITCGNCGAVSLTRDPFYDLNLEIPKEQQLKKIGAERGNDALTPQEKKGFFGSLGSMLGFTSPALSLETCMHSFCTSEGLQQKDQYKCDKCKTLTDAVKILSLGTPETLPEVLMLTIKRFSHNSYFGSKLSRHVTFPLHNLDVAPFLTQQQNQAQQAKQQQQKPAAATAKQSGKKPGIPAAASFSSASSPSPALYDLFAIVRHIGSQGSGHYVSYCKSHVTDQWFEFDDKIVTEMSEDKIAKIEAYILFYRRKYSAAPLERILKQVQAVTVAEPASPSAQPVRYVSKYWLKKMEVLGRPEPIDNRDLCCPHGIPKALPLNGGERAIAITPAGWESLFQEYGGGPIVDSANTPPCQPCQLPLLRKSERARISELDALASQQSDSDPFFLIEAPWLQAWRQFVSHNAVRPGPITNHLLLEADGETVRPNLKRGDDYRALHGLVWQELWKVYGGGPTIQRPTSDIYITEEPVRSQPMADEQQAAEADQEEQGQEDEEVDDGEDVQVAEADAEDVNDDTPQPVAHTSPPVTRSSARKQ